MIERWSTGEPAANMDEAILLDLGPSIRRHPWWAARGALTLRLLDDLGVRPPGRILDAGTGWGTTLDLLERRGFRAVGADISRRMLERLDRPGRHLAEVDLTRPLPGGIEPFDAALALDVIEHLDDDAEAVSRLGDLVRPGGLVVVSVPALAELFAEFDAVQGHRRRYDPARLRAAFEGSGLIVDRIFWWGGWMVPILRRRVGRSRARPGDSPADVYRRYLGLPPWPGPLVLRALFEAEQGRALAGRLRAGTSLFAVARKPVRPGDARGPRA